MTEIESQIRECFGRVVYSHKTHEKCADRLQGRLAAIKIWQIALSAITTGGLIVTIFGDAHQSKISALISAVFSTALLALNAYMKDFDPGRVAQEHKGVADKLWSIRESYLSLLTDLRSGGVDDRQARERRDALQGQLAPIYSSAPRTFKRGYQDAQKALKIGEDLTFSADEIDQFLPEPLKSTGGKSAAA